MFLLMEKSKKGLFVYNIHNYDLNIRKKTKLPLPIPLISCLIYRTLSALDFVTQHAKVIQYNKEESILPNEDGVVWRGNLDILSKVIHHIAIRY